MPARTNPFQRLSANVVALAYGERFLVEESVIVRSVRTGFPREIDLRVTDRESGDKVLMIECRDHRRKQDVQWIEQIEGKCKTLGFSNAVAISSSGFTKRAIEEADHKSIKTFTLKEADKIEWTKWILDIDKITLAEIDPIPKLVNINITSAKGHKSISLENLDMREIELRNVKDNSCIKLSDFCVYIALSDQVKHWVNSVNSKSENRLHTFNFIISDMSCERPDGNSFLISQISVTFEVVIISRDVYLTNVMLNDRKMKTGTVSDGDLEYSVTLEEVDKIVNMSFRTIQKIK